MLDILINARIIPLKPTNLVRTILLLISLIICLVTPVRADQSDVGIDPFETIADEKLVTTYRYPRPISKIAENVTVITADDIARINAHTLAEVLQTVPGIQLDQVQTPGSFTQFSILSATSRHILLEIDGVPQNLLAADMISSIGSIPVQMIERVEIVKGAASAAWGSALGGVVNVVTKSPDPDRTVGGLVSASAGEQRTIDLRGELSGTTGSFGYYLTSGNLRSDGFTPGTHTDLDHGFGKITYDLPGQGLMTFGLDIRKNHYGLEDIFPERYHDTGETKHASGYLNWKQPLADKLTLTVSGHLGKRELFTLFGYLDSAVLDQDSSLKENYHGADLNLNWGGLEKNVTFGLEYEKTDIKQRDPAGWVSEFNTDFNRTAAYLNGTYSLGRLTILPGIRLDHSNLFNDKISYTLGATYKLSDATILRIYCAKGFSLPIISDLTILNGSSKLQEIWTVQPGFETSAIPFLWVKGTFFYNDISDIQEWVYSDTGQASAILKSQVRQGFELEAKTVPIYGFALGGGYNYTHNRDKNTDKELSGDQSGVPLQAAKIALTYNNRDLGLTGSLNGNYAWWRMPADYNARYTATIWDLHLTQKIVPSSELSPELFFSVRNMFNSSQYTSDIRPNTPRWVEGGVRFRF